MIQSIAIQAYFNKLRGLLTRQGFDPSLKIVYGADAEGAQRFLDQDIADKEMPRKGVTSREDVRSNPYSYIFWTRESLNNIVRRPVYLRDGVIDGVPHFKKTVSASFSMGCVLVSDKASFIEDYSEAFAAEYQNAHSVPINLKFAYNDRNTVREGGFDTDGLNITVIQNLGTEELVSYRTGNLFSYSWTATLYLNFVSEFADFTASPLKKVVVDLYNPNGIPLSSMDFNGAAKWKEHTATDGTKVIVPETPYVEHSV